MADLNVFACCKFLRHIGKVSCSFTFAVTCLSVEKPRTLAMNLQTLHRF